MTNKIAVLFAGLLGLGLFAVSGSARAEFRDLCDSANICEYTGPNAPVLDAAVCLDAAGQASLKGSKPCPTGSVAFHARYGEVYEPIQQLVVGYIPLANACTAVPGLCEASDNYASNQSEAQAICCVGAVCWPGVDCGGTLMWCDDGVCNEDGTVTCFEGMGLDEEPE